MTVKVSPKYQVVIPEEIRKNLNIKPGMKINVISKGSVVYLVPVSSLEEIQKKLKGKFKSSDKKRLREKGDRKIS